LLIGSYRDAVFGKVTSHSYLQIGVSGSTDVYDDDIYDSLNLVILYNQYSFGDTTQSQKISVHKLTEKIELYENDVITSETTFGYDPNPIGSIIYTPRPHNSQDTLSIKISDAVGRDLFTKLRDNSEIMQSTDQFLNYFYGLVLRADETYEGAIVGFEGGENDVKLILHTRREAYTIEEIDYEFALFAATKQFNNFEHDLTTTLLNPLVDQRTELPDAKTGGLAFLQGGTGLMIRVDFPSLAEILMLDRGEIAEAQLSISPLENSYHELALPSQLVLYGADKLNRKTELVRTNQGALATSTLNLDEMYYENTAYVFDVTQYLTAELADAYFDSEKGLLITLPSEDLFNRLIIDSRNTKLKIYYLSY
jgi:hypothetical protein